MKTMLDDVKQIIREQRESQFIITMHVLSIISEATINFSATYGPTEHE